MTDSPPPLEAAAAISTSGNWLLTSASAKVDCVQRMRSALNAQGFKLFATDCDPYSAGLHAADAYFLLPPLDDDRFLDALISACRERDIHIILPTRDADLLYVARHRDALVANGIWPLLSATDTITICHDKLRFHNHCLRHNIPVLPRLTPPLTYPCFVRARHGAAGNGACRVDDVNTMIAMYGHPPWPDVLIQSLCKLPEYTIDAIFGFNGIPVQWIARERIKVRAGESVVSRTVHIPELDDLVQLVATSLDLLGPITLQAFYSPAQGPHLIEINPRIGGGAALGIEAGLATPERLVQLVQGNIDAFKRRRPLRIGLTMLRYTQDFFIREATECKH